MPANQSDVAFMTGRGDAHAKPCKRGAQFLEFGRGTGWRLAVFSGTWVGSRRISETVEQAGQIGDPAP